MTEAEPKESPNKGKGKAFFDRAEQVAETGNWDFAIEMYAEALLREPENVKRGHQPLREVSFKRKAQGGKPAGMMEQLKRRAGKDPATNLVNAAYLLAKDPGDVQHMIQLLRSAQKIEALDVVRWVGNILLESQKQAKKANKRILHDLAKAFESVKDFAQAVTCCDMALALDPNDGEIRSAQRTYSAQHAILIGQYEVDGDFTKGVKDMNKQQELMQKDSMVKDEEYLLEQIRKARQEYLESPKVAGKILALVEALLKIENESYENEAIDILNKAHHDSGAYQYKMKVGDIRIKQMSRRFRTLRDAGDAAGAKEQAQRQLAFELDEFNERAANYPTDLSLKFELGRRQFLMGKYDEAIGSLQQAQRNPLRQLKARSLIGQAFAKKGWYPQAADTFEGALKNEMTEEASKEIRYFLGDVLQTMNDLPKALDQFSMVAQVDYNYKDVRQRIEDIRQKIQAGGEDKSEAAPA
jgi:tetratricopeptide (TPR) repeat protein